MRLAVPAVLGLSLVVAGLTPARTAVAASAATLCPGPAGTGASLDGLAVTSGKNAWAVGSCNDRRTLILHWNGKAWSREPSPNFAGPDNPDYLSSAVAVSRDSAWAVGQTGTFAAPQTLILHWNGTAWKRLASPDPGGSGQANYLQSVTAVSASDAWAVGYCFTGRQAGQTMILHWNGRIWKRVPSPDPAGTTYNNVLEGVAASSPSNAWAVGSYDTRSGWRTLTLHWNGRAWKLVPSPNPNGNPPLNGTTTLSRSSAWAAGFYSSNGNAQTLIEHWNGRAWKLVPSPNPAGPLKDNALAGIAAVSHRLAWAFGSYTGNGLFPERQALILRWNGQAWKKMPMPDLGSGIGSGIGAVAVLSASSAWAAGQDNNGTVYRTLILHWNGTSWKRIPSP
jgi:hypothetical protein